MPSHLPEPRFSCTIPSIYDDTPLNIRIYQPTTLSRPQPSDHSNEKKLWRKKGIVMAHPYAPMGGSYDDRVVGIVVEEFLNAGWVVGTFDFRGAVGAKGRTSWSGKPELGDYQSFAGFFMHYMSYLRPNPSLNAVFTPDQSPISPTGQQSDKTPQVVTDETPIVILGGYSYGSLILKHLPPVLSILQPFSVPTSGSAAEEGLLRAHKLADQINLEWINQARDQDRKKHKFHEHKLSVTMGGEETSPEKRRSSREIRRSLDGGRSLDLGSRLRSLSHRRRNEEVLQTSAQATSIRPTIQVPEVRYLLISPLTPPISTLAAPGLARSFWSRSTQPGSEDILAKHKTLAVFGDQDMFSSARKMRDWVDRMQREAQDKFLNMEVGGAGHFWHEEGVERQLRDALMEWEKRVRE
ncbi:hypothetical protein N0V90_013295 [Kalmusia sp. IMI 367209]|nr:hypothetical protein N0V90_013295 [Kalmusia sp. IMI 367209]